MNHSTSRPARSAWKTGVCSTLIASLILASPGPWVYSVFAQGSSGRARLGSAGNGHDVMPIKPIRAEIGDMDAAGQTGLETDGIENAAIDLSLGQNGLGLGAEFGPAALQKQAGTAAGAAQQTPPHPSRPAPASTRQTLSRDAEMATHGIDGGKVTYDGALEGAPQSGEVRIGDTIERGTSLQRSAMEGRVTSSVEREFHFHAHEHEEKPAGILTWTLRAGLVAAAAAAILTGKVTLGIVPLAVLSAGVIGSIIAHEMAHMVVLKKLGDETAKKHGHDSLNPFHHVSFWNTIVMPIATLTASLGFFHLPFIAGAAKPIPADLNNMHRDRDDPFWVALAGPAANLAIAGAAYAASLALPAMGLLAIGGAGAWILHQLAWVNLGFAAFNLFVPLPGFDGAKVWARFLPKKWYDAYTHNPRLPASYQDIHRKLYVGPTYPLHLLGQLGFRTQPQVNRVVWGLNIAVAGAVFMASFLWMGAPVVYLMLACAYDYYCIREKIQNEDAVNSLIDILQDFTSELAQAAEQDDSIQSVINQEEVEHVMKNVLEDIIDKVIDSDGFESLNDDQKWERFTGVYTDEAVKALKEKGMTEDSPETIRRVLTQTAYGQRFFNRLREEFINRYDVWKKWHSPKRKSSGAPEFTKKEEPKKKGAMGGGSTMLSVAVVGALGASLLGYDLSSVAGLLGAGMVLGTVVQDPTMDEPPSAPKVKTFDDALNDPDLKFETKEKAFLKMHLKEMKLEEKPPVTGRIAEMMKLYKNVTAPRGDINSVVLIGEAGVGKTAIPEKLAQAIALSEAQPDGDTFKLNKMKGRYLLSLNLGKMLKDQDPSPVQKLDALIELLSRFNESSKKSGNKIILFIDEIHSIFEHPQGPLMAQLLKDVLRNGELTVIAATTRKEYKKYMESDDAFRRRLIPIWVDESTPAESMRALQGAKSYYEDLYDVKIDPDALKASAEMSKYDQEVFLPGRAFKYLLLAAKEGSFDNQRDRLSMAIQDKIEELRYVMKQLQEDLSTTELATENLKKDKPSTIDLYNWSVELTKEITALYRKRAAVPTTGTPVVTADMVKEQISAETGVAAGQLVLGQEDMSKYIDMAENLKKIVVGQDEAIDIISQAVKENKAGLSNPDQPLGVFYLTGPTGSGKTYSVRKIAEYLNMAMIRLDMSEYQHDHEVAKMQGAPPGYIGFEAGGQLTEKVRRNPYSVILFDEIEKAHPAVFMMLLQIMGEGRLTDGQGRLVDFKNTIIMMSSNLGMSALNEMLASYVVEYKQLKAELAAAGADTAKRMQIERKIVELSERMARDAKEPAKRITEEAFSKAYPPEFQGRFTAPPIVFNRVDYNMSLKIVDLELKKLRGTLEYAGNELTWDPTAVKSLAFEGFDIMLGARPLNNTIRRMVVQPIADAMLQAAKKNGNKIAPSRIRLMGTEDGKIQIVVEPLPPRVVKKTDTGEGAEQDVFSKVLGTVVQAVANQTNPEFGLHEIDGWVKEAVAAHPEQSPSDAPAVASPSEQTQNTEPVTITVSPAPVPPAPKTAGFSANTKLELGEGAERFVAESYRPKKDAGVIHAQKKLAEALAAKEYPAEVKDALVRAAGDKENPLVGALKLFVEQAKLMGQDDQSKPVQIAFEVTEGHARLVVHRNGAVSEKETAMWKTHFTGPVPSPNEARDKAEMLNVMGKDGRRVYFELYRGLSRIPGARIGWASGAKAEGGNGVDYWVELPMPPKPEPVAEPEPQEPSASATEPTNAALSKITTSAALASAQIEVEFAPNADSLGIMRHSGLLEPRRIEGEGIVFHAREISEVGIGEIAAKLATEPGVRAITVSPDARPYAEVALAPADPRAAKVHDGEGLTASNIRITTTLGSASHALNSADEAVDMAMEAMIHPDVRSIELHPQTRLRLLHRLRAQAPPGPQTASAAQSPLAAPSTHPQHSKIKVFEGNDSGLLNHPNQFLVKFHSGVLSYADKERVNQERIAPLLRELGLNVQPTLYTTDNDEILAYAQAATTEDAFANAVRLTGESSVIEIRVAPATMNAYLSLSAAAEGSLGASAPRAANGLPVKVVRDDSVPAGQFMIRFQENLSYFPYIADLRNRYQLGNVASQGNGWPIHQSFSDPAEARNLIFHLSSEEHVTEIRVNSELWNQFTPAPSSSASVPPANDSGTMGEENGSTFSAEQWRARLGHLAEFERDGRSHREPTAESELRLFVGLGSQHLSIFEQAGNRFGVSLSDRQGRWIDGRLVYTFQAPTPEAAAHAAIEFAGMTAFLIGSVQVSPAVLSEVRRIAGQPDVETPAPAPAASTTDRDDAFQRVISVDSLGPNEMVVHLRHGRPLAEANEILARAGARFRDQDYHRTGWGHVDFADAVAGARITRRLLQEEELFRVDVPAPVLALVQGGETVATADPRLAKIAARDGHDPIPSAIEVLFATEAAARGVLSRLGLFPSSSMRLDESGANMRISQPDETSAIALALELAAEEAVTFVALHPTTLLRLMSRVSPEPLVAELPQELLIKRTRIGYGEGEVTDAIVESGWGGPRRVSALLTQVGLPSNDPLLSLGTGHGVNGDRFTVGARNVAHAIELAARLSVDPRVLRVGLDEETYAAIDDRLATNSETVSRQNPKIRSFRVELDYVMVGGNAAFRWAEDWPVDKIVIVPAQGATSEQIEQALARHPGMAVESYVAYGAYLVHGASPASVIALSADPAIAQLQVPVEMIRSIDGPAFPARPDPRLAKLQAPAGARAEEPASTAFSFFIHPHQQSLANAVAHFAEPLMREFGLERRGDATFRGTSVGIEVPVEARTTDEAVAAAVWLAGHSHVKQVRLNPAMLERVREEIARQNRERAVSVQERPIAISELPTLLDHQWAKINPSAGSEEEGTGPSRFLWITSRVNTGEEGPAAAQRIAGPLGLEVRSQYRNSDGNLRARLEAGSATAASRATLALAALDDVLEVKVHPATWRLVPPRPLEGTPPPAVLNKIDAFPEGHGPQDHRWIDLSVAPASVDLVQNTLLGQFHLRWQGTTSAPGGQAGDSTVSAKARSLEEAVEKAIQLAALPEINGVRLCAATYELLRSRFSRSNAPEPAALEPNDARTSKIHELPAVAGAQANSVLWIDLPSPRAETDYVPPFVRETLERLGVTIPEHGVETFPDSGTPMIRITAHAPSAELAAFAALELARSPEVTSTYLHEEALTLAHQRPQTIGPSDPRLLKIRSATGPILSNEPSRLLWFEYILHHEDGLPDGGALHGEIYPLLRRLNLEHKVHQWHGSNYRVQAEAPTLRVALDAALALAADPRVREIDMHPSTWRLLQSRVVRTWDQDLSPPDRNRRIQHIGTLPDSLRDGPADVVLADIAQTLPGERGTQHLIRSFIEPVFSELGLRFTEGELLNDSPRIYRARGRAGNAETAALAALALIARQGVYQTLIHPDAEALLRLRLFGAQNGGPKSQASASGPSRGASARSGGSSGSGAPSRAAAQARDTLRKFLYALIAQGTDKRSWSVLTAAGDALSAVSNAEDLDKARKDWIRFERNHLHHRYAELGAAALIIAKQGGGEEDYQQLMAAAGQINHTSGHTMQPPKRRVAHALAKLLAAKLKPGQYAEALRKEKAKTYDSSTDPSHFENAQNDTRLTAYYIAAARNADLSARKEMEDYWYRDKTFLLAEYFERVDPAYMQSLYESWKKEPKAGNDRQGLLTAYAIAEHGTIDDLPHFLETMRTYGEYGNLQGVADAFARFVKRVGAMPTIRKKMHDWLFSLNSSGLGDSFIAMTVLGEAGTEEDLPIIEKWVMTSPDQVQNNPFHEMTHHEATVSWAKMVVRFGRMEKYLTEVQPAPVGKRSATKIVQMLTDTNPMANKAALAAIQLYFGGDEDFGI